MLEVGGGGGLGSLGCLCVRVLLGGVDDDDLGCAAVDRLEHAEAVVPVEGGDLVGRRVSGVVVGRGGVLGGGDQEGVGAGRT